MESTLPRLTVTQNEISLSYIKFGEGGPFIVALHGHGRVAEDYLFLKNQGIVISIDLFFHGQSKFPEERIEKNPLTSKEFHDLFKLILKNEGVKKYHLVAFSQGGRFALSLLPQEISNCLSIQLISPDGMDNNSFYNRMSRLRLARNLFIRWEKKPRKLITFAGLGRRLGFVRPKVHAFVKKFAADHQSFARASKTWRGFRNIQPIEHQIKSALRVNKVIFVVIMGKYDQVIRTKQAISFLRRIEQPNSLIELDCGHDFFNEKNLETLRNLLIIK